MLRKLTQRQPVNHLQWLVLLLGGLFLLNLITFFVAEGFWFQAVDYLQEFVTRIGTRVGLGVVAFALSLGVLVANLIWADQRVWLPPLSERDRPTLPGHMRLVRLLPLAILISLVIGVLLIYHGQIAVSHWHPRLSLYSTSTPLPLRFRPRIVWDVVQQWRSQVWQPVLAAGVAIALLIFPQFLLWAIAVLMSFSFGVILSEHWAEVLLALNSTAFNQLDPIFNRDIGFYVFSLPWWELFEFWFVGLSVLTFLSVCLIYLLSGNSLSQGYFPGFSASQQRHLSGLGGVVMLAVALNYWLDRYSLLYSSEGVAYGATYTNVTVQLPVYTLLSVLALILAGWLLGRTMLWTRQRRRRSSLMNPAAKPTSKPGSTRKNLGLSDVDGVLTERAKLRNGWRSRQVVVSPQSAQNFSDQSLRPPLNTRPLRNPQTPTPRSETAPHFYCLLYSIVLYVGLAAVAGFALPAVVQRLVVQPNELQLERPYLQNTIALTRKAFDLDTINVETFDPQNTLSYEALEENELTIDNIRIWDTRPLLQTNRQLQRIRLYYEFPDADIDRYTLPDEDGGTSQRQVLIAARELNYQDVPTAAQTWVNEHLIYTHGYGFTLSPVNVAGEGGLPDYFVRGIEPMLVAPEVRDSIPIGKPRIYYGELTDNYVMIQTRVRELDYPSGSDNVYNVYDGWGGVSIGNLWRRLLVAKYLGDWRMLFTDNFTPQTRLLFRRNINDRVRAIAPFLRYDSDPYLVVVDTNGKTWEHGYSRSLTFESQAPDQSYLYWIIDAYTTSNRYPYSDPGENDFNYIRNSVKVVIDAYHGAVNFYVVEPNDPVIQSWQRVFPDMFQPIDQMPEALLRHIRYAQDIYRVQSNQLMTYHMTDPIVFYNREDQWRAPTEIYGDQSQLVEPYYLIMKLPTGTSEEFILLRPFTPVQRNNLIAWLAARSDVEQYGTMLLYSFPKQELVYGPEQIEARINQDPVISQQISLWNRQGSSAIQGNLLVIPIDQSLLYVEPLYLEAEQNSLPTLARVIVVYGSRIVMAETLEEALSAIFQPPSDAAPVIIRSVEEEVLPDVEVDNIVPVPGEGGSLPGPEQEDAPVE